MAKHALFLLAIVLLLVACKSLKSGAKESFARKYSCPEDRVTVTPRPDADPARPYPFPTPKPPPEVANDPDRLAKFNADQEEKKARWSKNTTGAEMFEVSGCGHTEMLRCEHPSRPDGQRMEQVICQ